MYKRERENKNRLKYHNNQKGIMKGKTLGKLFKKYIFGYIYNKIIWNISK